MDDALAAGRQQVEPDLVEASSRLLADGRQLDGARALSRRHHTVACYQRHDTTHVISVTTPYINTPETSRRYYLGIFQVS